MNCSLDMFECRASNNYFKKINPIEIIIPNPILIL